MGKSLRYLYALFVVDLLWAIAIGYIMDNNNPDVKYSEIVLLQLSTIFLYVAVLWGVLKSDKQWYPKSKTQLATLIVLMVFVFTIPFYLASKEPAINAFYILNLTF